MDAAGGAPSAKFLQARLTTLTTTLVRRFENILAAALPSYNPSPIYQPNNTNTTTAPSLTTTAIDQFQLDVESTALIRAAEEIMVLTRRLKDLWLFGGLDTLREDQEEVKDEKLEDDRMLVDEFVRRVLMGVDDQTGLNVAAVSTEKVAKETSS